jgi:Animal haem peroxidase
MPASGAPRSGGSAVIRPARMAVTRDCCLAPGRAAAATPLRESGYRRLFVELPPLVSDVRQLQELGTPGGLSDAETVAPEEPDDASGPAGRPIFGQFVAHDLTADPSPLVDRADPAALRNFRLPKANLESLYGLGPTGTPYMFSRRDPAKFLLGGSGCDVPRNAEGTAIIGDPRNDTHVFMSQLNMAFLRAHNLLVDRLREDGVAEEDLVARARCSLTWHYQWLIVHEFLPAVIGERLAQSLLTDGPAFYRPEDEPYIPLEFADAAYRYGHSQIRSRYVINRATGPVPMFPDLMGFRPVAPEHAVDWSLMFDFPGRPPAQRAKRIDEKLTAPLIRLPADLTGPVTEEPHHSLAVRDLQRGLATGLPSGEAVAARLGVTPLTSDEVGLSAMGWAGETPLWLYVGREAAVRQGGDRLGEVGGRIVGEVLVGIIRADPGSFLSADPGWHPTLPAVRPGQFSITDLLSNALGGG